MIRFIDLRGQIFLDDKGPHFAFFNTVVDRFEMFAGEQEWQDEQDFVTAVLIEARGLPVTSPLAPKWDDRVKRYLDLIPEGYFAQEPEPDMDLLLEVARNAVKRAEARALEAESKLQIALTVARIPDHLHAAYLMEKSAQAGRKTGLEEAAKICADLELWQTEAVIRSRIAQ